MGAGRRVARPTASTGKEMWQEGMSDAHWQWHQQNGGGPYGAVPLHPLSTGYSWFANFTRPYTNSHGSKPSLVHVGIPRGMKAGGYAQGQDYGTFGIAGMNNWGRCFMSFDGAQADEHIT